MSEFSLILLAAAALLVARYYPVHAGAAIVALLPSYLLRFNFLGIPTTFLEIIIYGVFVGMLWRFGGEMVRPLLSRRELLWMGLLLAVGAVGGVAVSPNPVESLGIIKGWMIDPVLAGLIIYRMWTISGFDKWAAWLSLSGALLSVHAVWQVLNESFVTVDLRASSVFSSANYLSLYLGPVGIICLGWFLKAWKEKRKGEAVLAGIFFIAILLGLYLTRSYAAWLSVVAGGALLIWMLLRQKLWALGAAALGLLTFVALELGSPKLMKLFDFAGRSSSSIRLQIWETALLMIRENPLFGIGLGQFQRTYPSYAERLFSPPLEWIVLHAHNLWLYTWLQLGIFGLAALLWLVVRAIILLSQGARQSFWAKVILSSLVTLLLHGTVDLPVWKNDLSIIFIMLVIAGWWFHEHKEQA